MRHSILPALVGYLFVLSAAQVAADFSDLTVQPPDDCVFIGPQGGPFNPSSCDFNLVNAGAAPVDVRLEVVVLFEPPWLEAVVDGQLLTAPEPGADPFIATVPGNGSLPFSLRLTDTASGVTDPDNAGVFGQLSIFDPNDIRQELNAVGRFEFVVGNDSFAGARPIDPVLGGVSDTNVGTTKEPGEPDHAGNPGGASVWFRYDAPTGVAGSISFTTEFSDIDTLLAVYTGSDVANLTPVVSNDNGAGVAHSVVNFDIQAGTTYFIALDSVGAETGFFQLNFSQSLTLLNDDFADAAVLSGLAGEITQPVFFGSNVSRETGEPAHGGGAGGSTWYRWQAPATGVFRFSVPATFTTPVVAIYLGDSVTDLTEVVSNTIFAGAANQLDLPAVAGATYRIALVDNGVDSFPLSWELLDPQPAVGLFSSILPASRAVQLGQVATVFGNLFNSSSEEGINCRPEPPNQLFEFTPVRFDYQITDASNLLTGTPNTPVNIPPGSVQNFLLQLDPPSVITGGRLGIRFLCDNLAAAPTFPDANAWILRALTTEPADVIAVGVSTGEPGVVDVPLSGGAAFAAAGVNIGADVTVVVSPSLTFDAGLTLTVCETDVAGACLAPPLPSLSIVPFARNQLRTFSVFVNGDGQDQGFDPGFRRVFLNFTQASAQGPLLVGATSLAVRTAQ